MILWQMEEDIHHYFESVLHYDDPSIENVDSSLENDDPSSGSSKSWMRSTLGC